MYVPNVTLDDQIEEKFGFYTTKKVTSHNVEMTYFKRLFYCISVFSAACTVLNSNIVMVIGPTPPGTGVI